MVLDTGPMLCIGGGGPARSDGARDAAWRRLRKRAFYPKAVDAELRYLVRLADGLEMAAEKAISPPRSTFVALDERSFSKASRAEVRKLVIAAEERRSRPKTSGHDGEINSILLCQEIGGILLTNDYAAASVAAHLGVPVGTFGSLLAAEVRDQQLDASRATAIALSLEEQGIHCGIRKNRINDMVFSSFEVPENL